LKRTLLAFFSVAFSKISQVMTGSDRKNVQVICGKVTAHGSQSPTLISKGQQLWEPDRH